VVLEKVHLIDIEDAAVDLAQNPGSNRFSPVLRACSMSSEPTTRSSVARRGGPRPYSLRFRRQYFADLHPFRQEAHMPLPPRSQAERAIVRRDVRQQLSESSDGS